MKNRILLLIIALLLTGCQSVQGKLNKNGLLDWKYGDLRLLDPIDAIEPDQDLIALYSRINDQMFQIRIDFLDLITSSRKDIYIAIDTNPGGMTKIAINKNDTVPVEISWDYLIKIPSSGSVVIMDDHLLPVYGMALLIVRDIAQDRIVISFNKNILPISLSKTKLQVIITPSNQNLVADKSDPFSIDASSPVRAKVLFAFWNTFSATTPAQTLRSWAGAHEGPMSSRHGLKYLLDAAAQTKSTVLLFDLLTPDTLSALDYLNALPRIRKLADQGILVLPSVGNITQFDVTDDVNSAYLDKNLENYLDVNKIWNISSNAEVRLTNRKSNLFILLNNVFLNKNKDINIGANDYAKLNENINTCSLLPDRKYTQVITSGLTLECKKLLLSSAMTASPTPLILGGDFSNSILGDPSGSSKVFSYINEHPWIQKLSIYDLMTANDLVVNNPLPYSIDQSTPSEVVQQPNTIYDSDSSSVQAKIYESLIQSPKNLITDMAWQVYDSLTQPASSDLLSLRINYLGQIGQLLAAAEWAEKPAYNATCDLDLDYDSKNECILANNSIFAIVEPEGGYIPFVFSLDASGIHQIIGPTWEFIVGISDPSTWELSLGVRSDSEQILGAFSDSFHDWNNYDVDLMNSIIFMSSESMTMRKTVSILPDGLHIEIQVLDKSPTNAYIPLVVDPWIRYSTPGWGDLYTSIKSPSELQWGINSGEAVKIRSANQITGFSFNATHAALAYPENPNFDYSRGHYLPFPMALAQISSTDNYFVDIIINPR
jgi:hypothetical protein